MSEALFEDRTFHAPLPAADWAAPEGEAAMTSSVLIHKVRWHTGLSQTEFALTYRIDPEHLRALERGEAAPDSALLAYLTVIDRSPEVVRAALQGC